jgi:FlaA1/EpsC-like NDP-sugar epimerase
MIQHRLARFLLALPRPHKRLLALFSDVAFCILATWLAFYLRLETWLPLTGSPFQPLLAVMASVVLALPVFICLGLYRAIFRYSGAASLRAILRAACLYGAIYATVITIFRLPGVPRAIGILQPILLFALVAASRLLARYWLGGDYQKRLHRMNLPRILIYGAGQAGRQVAAALAHSNELQVAGFLDDDPRLQQHTVNHLPIDNPARLPDLVAMKGISSVLLAIPSASRHQRDVLLKKIAQAKVETLAMPDLTQLAQGKIGISELRELNLDDLLGREPVTPDPILLMRHITDKIVLVTGAGGSIGSELCRQALSLRPACLLLVEQSEFALYHLHQELTQKLSGIQQTAAGSAAPRLVPILASVTDEARMLAILEAWRPAIIYHAAAYKHVPLVEHNPVTGLFNNAFGTLAMARAARLAGIARFVLISTDKAVRPASVMGASKRLAEMILQAMAREITPDDAPGSHTVFAMVRFGNVLNSSGSVVPRFYQQIRAGGPLTLTHPEMTRYFMSIPEAATLVIQAGSLASSQGGEVFLLNMGEPVQLKELATRMVKLSGLSVRDEANPEGDIAIDITGLRPGEKLYEELLITADAESTAHPRIMKAREDFMPWAALSPQLDILAARLAKNDIPAIRQWLADVVLGYTPESTLVDWLWRQQNRKHEQQA